LSACGRYSQLYSPGGSSHAAFRCLYCSDLCAYFPRLATSERVLLLFRRRLFTSGAGEDGSVAMAETGGRQSVASSTSSVTDLSGSRHAPSCPCEDATPSEEELACTRHPLNPGTRAAGSSRSCVVHGLTRNKDDSGLDSEVRRIHRVTVT